MSRQNNSCIPGQLYTWDDRHATDHYFWVLLPTGRCSSQEFLVDNPIVMYIRQYVGGLDDWGVYLVGDRMGVSKMRNFKLVNI